MGEKDKKDSPLIVIAGSHYRRYNELAYSEQDKKIQEIEKVYNVSPILLYRNEEITIYEQFKNKFERHEKEFFEELKKNDMFSKKTELGEGRGFLVLRTELGRIAVSICSFDPTDAALVAELKNKLDILIMTSWVEYKNSFSKNYESIVNLIGSWIVFANNGNKGGSRLFGPVKEAKTPIAEGSLQPADKGDRIKYLIVGHKIRGRQRGEEQAEDEHYVYRRPRA
jgi:hypothetical protein